MTEAKVDDMQNLALKEQRRDLTSLTDRVNALEIKISELLGQIATLSNIGKALVGAFGVLAGVQVAPMV